MEWFTTECGKYRIESLSPATIPGALNVIRVAFCQDETVCQGTEVNINPIAIEELLELCADAALDGVSLVAIDTQTNEVVSVSFNKLQEASTTEKPFFEIFAEERCTQGASRALIQFMAEVDERINIFEKYQEDCSLEIMFLATTREYRRQNLGTLLCKYSIELAKKLKDGPVAKITLEDLGPAYSKMQSRVVTSKYPKFCQAICTSIGTQKIANNLGFTVHLRISFDEFVYNGKSYVERIGFDPYCEGVGLKMY